METCEISYRITGVTRLLNYNDFVFEALSKSEVDGEHRWAATEQFQCFSVLPRPNKKALAAHHSLIQKLLATGWREQPLEKAPASWWYRKFSRADAPSKT
jgi:hypothetical protein